MYFVYSVLLSVAFLLMSPLFLLRRDKYAAGLSQRLGNYPAFEQDGRKVIWLHCVSVGEANAARPLADALVNDFPGHRLIVSTTTKTGQELASRIFAGRADAIFYLPFDWKFSVRRALRRFEPTVILLLETEIWPRLIHEAKTSGVKVAIVNGRLSERSFSRYSQVGWLIRRVLWGIDAALMQGANDANRLISLGIPAAKAKVTGNMKFDIADDPRDAEIAADMNKRFRFDDGRPVIVAASTHDPEERWMLDAFCSILAGEAKIKPRLVIAPRHPERFDDVADLLRKFRDEEACEFKRYRVVRRSEEPGDADAEADIILLDSIGELRSLYRLTSVAFVGGSLVPHGGQSVLEPAAAGNAIITGPHTFNFADVISVFLANKAVIQLPEQANEAIPDDLFMHISDLLEEPEECSRLARSARAVMEANRGATEKTIAELRRLLTS
ncbi:MAG TPA: 3-deoxy-D-manno-octulosonic acid transferase [Pyrinomonadaceae bacterium]|nr:3-deoxy-D-manno-octulosonic acid transferase [Pyrinomonadaceae bacterium]HMP66520.1 3-deoxy-D-manno-octulosonic acid transferase [Pyrinomonadaceae bacterium]